MCLATEAYINMCWISWIFLCWYTLNKIRFKFHCWKCGNVVLAERELWICPRRLTWRLWTQTPDLSSPLFRSKVSKGLLKYSVFRWPFIQQPPIKINPIKANLTKLFDQKKKKSHLMYASEPARVFLCVFFNRCEFSIPMCPFKSNRSNFFLTHKTKTIWSYYYFRLLAIITVQRGIPFHFQIPDLK